MARPVSHGTTKKVLKFICEYKHKQDGVAPSMQEITQGCGLASTSTTSYHLKKLTDMDLITYAPGSKRNIRVPGIWNAKNKNEVIDALFDVSEVLGK